MFGLQYDDGSSRREDDEPGLGESEVQHDGHLDNLLEKVKCVKRETSSAQLKIGLRINFNYRGIMSMVPD